MKFRCERDTLAEAVATAQRTVASRTGALPVLQDLRITASADGLELVGSDLEITNRVQVPAEVEETGVAVVPKLLGEIVRKLEPGPVTVTVTGDEAVITAGRFSTSLRLKPAEDYPRLASSDGQGVRRRRGGVRARRCARSCAAASKDDLRPILTGVLLTAHAGGLRLVATDSYRLAVRDLKGVSMLAEGQRVLVAAKGLPRCSGSPATARSKSCCASATSCSARRGPRSRRGSSKASSRTTSSSSRAATRTG